VGYVKGGTMRRFVLITITCSAILGGLALGPLSAAAVSRDAFRGNWTSTDTDGSHQTLAVGGSGQARHHSVFYTDDAATRACGGDPAQGTGSGTVDGGTMYAKVALTCLPGGNHFRTRLTLAYTYDQGTDTLTDTSGVVWDRAD
jgi:hypothetical protein